MDNLKKIIRDVTDFPKKGIVFKDITTLLKDPESFNRTVQYLVNECRKYSVNKIAGIESRGFIFGAPVARELNAGFIPVRKPGKLPAETVCQSYELEYGSDSVEVHCDAFSKGDNVIIIDDLLATGGTADAACKLIEKCGANVSLVAFVVELTFLNGRQKLKNRNVFSLLEF